MYTGLNVDLVNCWQGEVERGVSELGIGYVERGPVGCDCLTCIQHRLDSLRQESSYLLQPAKDMLLNELKRSLSVVEHHPLKQEDPQEFSSWEHQLVHIKGNPMLSLTDRIASLQTLASSMNSSMERIREEKNNIWKAIVEKNLVLGMETVKTPQLTISELDSKLQNLDNQIVIRRGQVQHSSQVIDRLWQFMSVSAAERFPLIPTDLSEANIARLDGEKNRLFVLQKERFREMLEAQQAELESLWSALDYPETAKESARASLCSMEPIESLASLTEHVVRLKPVLVARNEISCKILKRQNLVQKMKEFEKTAKDPNRLFGPSFRLMEEDRFRKTAYPSLIRLESQLEVDLAIWKQKFPLDDLWWQGKPFADMLAEERENRYINESIFEFTTPNKLDDSLCQKAKSSILPTTSSSIRNPLKQTSRKKIN